MRCGSSAIYYAMMERETEIWLFWIDLRESSARVWREREGFTSVSRCTATAFG